VSLVHRFISRRHTVGFKRVWMRGVSEEHMDYHDSDPFDNNC
jgi:hypothetical protein